MHAIPSTMPLSCTASLTSSVMSRTARPPAVRNSLWRWKTFTAPYSEHSGGLCNWEPRRFRFREVCGAGRPHSWAFALTSAARGVNDARVLRLGRAWRHVGKTAGGRLTHPVETSLRRGPCGRGGTEGEHE